MDKRVTALAGAVVVAGAAVAGILLVRAVLARKSLLDDAVSAVESRLDELDPVTRAAAVATIAADEARSVHRHKP